MAIQELKALEGSNSFIRIAFQQDVPVTARVLRLIDSEAFQRLKQIPQLGFVRTVYPSATHTRFEHSLGVYHLALQYIRHFQANDYFVREVPNQELETFILAALLHDIGHWPYCHPMEDMGLPHIPHHEHFAELAISSPEVSDLIYKDWSVTADEVITFLKGQATNHTQRFLYRLLSSPIDIDKLDYLQRDSLHAGVPYGRNFDRNRLINGLRYCSESNLLTISSKALTATEMMVFARYVMFSEVYWHRTVRSATSMLQRSLFTIQDQVAVIQRLITSTEPEFQTVLCNYDRTGIADSLFGSKRELYKSAYETNDSTDPELYSAARNHDFENLVAASTRLAKRLQLPPQAVIIDAAPQQLEVQFNLEVRDENTETTQQLADVSPVVNSLATDQFDHYVKRLRVFVAPEYRDLNLDRQVILDALS